MSDLFWPGDARAGGLLSEEALLDAMVRVEEAWLGNPRPAMPALRPEDLTSEAAGNPVPSLVAVLRERTGDDRVHRGLTSQDVLDSALMLCLLDVVTFTSKQVRAQVVALADLARRHRETPMVARTLTQHAVPSTFGLKAAQWLAGVLDAHDDLSALSFPVQLGGAAGTMAAAVELGRDPARARAELAEALGLADAPPWHTVRRPVTRIGDVLVACSDAWGHLANDVLTLSRPELGELSEGSPGGSSTMPHKQNPVLATLVRRAALAAPQLAATLHLAAADQVDERAAGAWHVEWATLRDLGRRTAVAASQTTELVSALVVHPDRMADTLAGARDDVRAEQGTMSGGREPTGDYLGEAHALVDAVLTRAQEALP